MSEKEMWGSGMTRKGSHFLAPFPYPRFFFLHGQTLDTEIRMKGGERPPKPLLLSSIQSSSPVRLPLMMFEGMRTREKARAKMMPN